MLMTDLNEKIFSPIESCSNHIELWNYLGKGQNFAAFACLKHGLVFKFVIRRSNYADYSQKRNNFLDQILSLYPELATFSTDRFLTLSYISPGVLQKLSKLEILSGKTISVTDIKSIALTFDLTKQVCLKLLGYSELTELADQAYDKVSSVNELSPVLAIELKPKSGLLNPESQYEELSNICRHKLIQINRQYKDGASAKSSGNTIYDPLELFSENYETQVNCMQNMIKSSSKYLKVFWNGRFMDLDLTQKCLKSFDQSLNDYEFACLLISTFRQCEVLDLLSRCHILGLLSPEKAKKMIDTFEIQFEDVEFSSYTLRKYRNLISKLKIEQASNFSQLQKFTKNCSPEDYVILCLIGFSLVDVSIFLSFVKEETVLRYSGDRLLKLDEVSSISRNGQKLFFSCDVIDVDFKGVKTIMKHCKDNLEAVEHWRSLHYEERSTLLEN